MTITVTEPREFYKRKIDYFKRITNEMNMLMLKLMCLTVKLSIFKWGHTKMPFKNLYKARTVWKTGF